MRGRAVILAGWLAAALAGCSSDGPTDLARVGMAVADAVAPGDTPAPAPLPSRAALEAQPSSVIVVALGARDGAEAGAERAHAALVPVVKNGPYLTYVDEEYRGVVLHGSALAGTRGQPFDLIGVRHGPDDPIAHPRGLAAWPSAIGREYQFLQRDLGPYSIVLRCDYTRVATEEIEILGRPFALARIEENCTNPKRRVTNIYWVEERTGMIWRSEQWAGPETGHVTIEVIRPYRG